MKINYTVKFLICTFIVLTFCGGASAVIAAQISGTVYDSVGSLISDGGTVYAYTGNPCEAIEWGMPTGIGTIGADGTFSITEDWMGGSLPAGDYYLYAYPSGNYFSEWWTDSGSVPDCSQAQVVSVAADETVTGKDFQLNFGARISGNVYDSSGTPITTGSVTAYTGDPCDIYYSAGSGYINSDGSYTIQKLTAGDYYLRADSSNAQYPEWWAEPESSPDCNQAQAVTVTAGETVTHKDFQLDLGAQITGTVYYSAGNPVSDSWEVVAVAGDPCGAYSTVKYAWTDMMDGTYSLGGLPPGSYYLGSRFMSSDVSQWWTESGSSPECAQAQLVTVASEDSLNSMDFELDNGAQISGIVYESDGTTLVNYGYVYAYANTSGDPCMGMWDYAGSGYINSDGTYTIVGLAAGNYYLQADSGNYYSEWWADPASTQDCSQAQTVTVGAFETVTGRDFQLDTAPSISGRLYDSAGNPITYTDAYVELYTGDPCESSNYPVNSGGIDWESGTYTVRGVSPGEYFLKANAYGNYVSEWWADPASSSDCTVAQAVTVAEGETVTGKDFQLDFVTNAQISGIVYDSAGSPISGGTVTAYTNTSDPCMWYGDYAGSGNINSDGSYTIAGLTGGDYYLLADSNGAHFSEWWADPASSQDCSEAQTVTVMADETVTGKDFQLDPAAGISGTVYESDGTTPITGGYVNVYTGDPCSLYDYVGYGYINLDGTYTIEGLPGGSYYLHAESFGNHLTEWWASPQSNPDCGQAQIVTVALGETVTDRDFQLDLGAQISGTVYESDGATPVTGGGYVYAITGDPCGSNSGIGYWINENGSYTIQRLPAGDYYLQAYPYDNHFVEWWGFPLSSPDCSQAQQVTVSSGETVTDKNFQLDIETHDAQISGTVYDSTDSPITDGYVTAYIGSPCDLDWGGAQSVGTGSLNPDGSYVISSLASGTYYLLADSNGAHFSEWWADSASSPDCSQAQPVTMAVGEVVIDRDFQLDPAARITGTVYESDGTTPITGGYVEVTNTSDPCSWNDYAGSGYINPDGTYAIDNLPGGNYYLKAYPSGNYFSEWWADPASSPDCSQAQPMTVPAGEIVTNRDFQLDAAAQISGTVYDNAGNPIDGIEGGEVYAFTGDPCGGYYAGSGGVNFDGTYTIQGLPAGDYYLRASTWSGNYVSEWWADPASTSDCSQAQPVTVAAGETVTGRDFQLDLGAQISGTVYESDGTTPVTSDGYVSVYTGPCGSGYVGDGWINSSDGTYTVQGLPAGEYYLQASSFGNHLSEWWADPASTSDCSQAQPVTVAAGETVTGRDFQLDLGAQISGTVYESDGITPVTSDGYVSMYTGPCGGGSYAGSGWFNSSDGTYTVQGLPAGEYYLQASSSGNHLSEWWADPASVLDCSQAQPVTVAVGETVTGRDFQLDPGAQISGTVYESDGTTPITSYGEVDVYTGPCGSGELVNIGSFTPYSSGTYIVQGLPAGEYYLLAYSNGNHVAEWWADPTSTPDCTQAQPVTVAAEETVTGRDFQLDGGARISGTVYESDGTTPVPYNGYISAYTGDPCGDYSVVFSSSIWDGNGDYLIYGLPAGDYFLRVIPYLGDYLPEWWADPASSPDCTQAQVVTMEAGETVTGKNFQLDAISTTYTVTTLVDPPGSGTVDGGDTYIVGATATLTANPGAGYVFTGWSGDVTGTENPVQIVVYSDKTITANFALMNTITLTADASGNGSGTVSSDVGGINYAYPAANTATTTPLNLGSSITLTATAETGSTASWMGCASTGGTTTAATCSFASLDANTTVTAIFTLNTHTVTTLADPVEGGTVDGGGIFNWGETATLTANPAVGYAFSGWSGSITGMENPVQVTVDSDKTITANFILLPSYTVSTSANPLDGGSVIGGGSYYEGSTAILTANPAAGYVFTGWSGDVSGMENPIQVQVNSDKTITANFTLAAAYTVTASANPSEGGAVDGGGSYNAGDTATLTAIPAEGYVFIGWSGDATGIDNPLSVAVDSDMNITANFKKKGKLTFPIRAKDGQIVIISL